MAYIVKTFDEILAGFGAALRQYINNVDTSPITWWIKEGAVISSVAEGLYIKGQTILDSHNLLLAEGADLDRIADEHGYTRKPGVKARGIQRFEGEESATIPLGTRVETGEDQDGNTKVFVTIEAGVISSGIADVDCEAEEVGTAYNVGVGTIETITASLEDIDLTTNQAVYAGGVDIESDADMRARILSLVTDPKNGGSNIDLRRWAREVDGVDKSKCIDDEPRGPGTADVIITQNSAVPTGDKVDEVQDYIEDRRSVTADILVKAAVAHTIDVDAVIVIADGYLEADVITAVETNLSAFFRGLDIGAKVEIGDIANVIHDTDGVDNYSDLEIEAGVIDIQLDDDEIATDGTFTITT